MEQFDLIFNFLFQLGEHLRRVYINLIFLSKLDKKVLRYRVQGYKRAIQKCNFRRMSVKAPWSPVTYKQEHYLVGTMHDALSAL